MCGESAGGGKVVWVGWVVMGARPVAMCCLGGGWGGPIPPALVGCVCREVDRVGTVGGGVALV